MWRFGLESPLCGSLHHLMAGFAHPITCDAKAISVIVSVEAITRYTLRQNENMPMPGFHGERQC
jgi:hypothetical protein